MRSRSSVLELAVLGLLHAAPMHGYELRKRLNEMLGLLRPFSYGSLYPCLRALADEADITASDTEDLGAPGASKRARIVYRLTNQGSERLEHLLGEAGPASWEDENFDVRFALFAQTDVDTRIRVLEGRRTRMAERLDALHASANRGLPTDLYSQELRRHAADQLERELRWLEDLIDQERSARRTARRQLTATPASTNSPTKLKESK